MGRFYEKKRGWQSREDRCQNRSQSPFGGKRSSKWSSLGRGGSIVNDLEGFLKEHIVPLKKGEVVRGVQLNMQQM